MQNSEFTELTEFPLSIVFEELLLESRHDFINIPKSHKNDIKYAFGILKRMFYQSKLKSKAHRVLVTSKISWHVAHYTCCSRFACVREDYESSSS